MLLGDTLILDNLDNANAYRQEVGSRGQVMLQWWCVACVLSSCACAPQPLLVGCLSSVLCSLSGELFCSPSGELYSLGNCVLCSPSRELCSLFFLWGTLFSLWGTLMLIAK